MLWPNYIMVLLFVVIVALVVYFGRQQARNLMVRNKARGDGDMAALAGELRRTNDMLEKVLGEQDARIRALEAKAFEAKALGSKTLGSKTLGAKDRSDMP